MEKAMVEVLNRIATILEGILEQEKLRTEFLKREQTIPPPYSNEVDAEFLENMPE